MARDSRQELRERKKRYKEKKIHDKRQETKDINAERETEDANLLLCCTVLL